MINHQQLKTVEIDVEKDIFRVNGKDIKYYAGYLRIEYQDGEWVVSDKYFGANNIYKEELEKRMEKIEEDISDLSFGNPFMMLRRKDCEQKEKSNI